MANDVEKRISAKVILDSTGFNKSLKGVNQQLQVTQTEFKAGSERLSQFGKATDKLKYNSEGLSRQIELQKQKVDIWKESISKANSKIQESIKERDKLKQELDSLNGEYEQAIKLYGKESKEVQELQGKLNTLNKEYKQKENAVENAAKQVNYYTINMNKAEQGLAKMQNELRSTNTELAKQESRLIKAGKAFENASGKMKSVGSSMSSVGNTLSIGVTAPLLAIGTAATKMAMDAVESENLFEVSMGSMAGAARQWSEGLRKELGLNAYEVRKNIGTYNAMLNSMGLTEKQAYDMSTSMTKLAYDMASFYNLKPEQAFDKLRAGISGEAEPLKQLGILVSENTIKTYAYTHGIAKQGKELTEQQKVLARYGVIMEQTKMAQGDMARTLDSPTNKLRVQTEQIKQQGIELGTKLIPLMSKGLDVIKPIVDYVSNLSDEQKEMAIRMAMVAMAAGPLLSITGKFLSVGGTVVGTVGKISSALGTAKTATTVAGTAASVAGGAGGFAGLAGSLGTVAVAALPWIAGAAAVAGAGYLVYKGLTKETIPAVDLFADKVEVTSTRVAEAGDYMGGSYETSVTKISEGTKKAIGAYVNLDDGVRNNLNNLYINSSVVTDQIKNDTVTKFSEMKNQVVAGYESQKNESIQKLQQMFSSAQGITAEEQKQLLTSTNEYYQNKAATTQGYEQQIQQIMSNASNGKRSLTSDEMNTITSLQNSMRENAINALSENEIEAKVILQRMKDYDTRITAEQASTHIKQLNDSKDKAVKAANEEYEKRIALIEKLRAEGAIKSQDQADKMIAEAKRQRDGVVQKAEETRLGAIEKMRSMNSDLDSQVNTSTGNILSTWEKLKRWWNGWKPETKNFDYKVNESRRKTQMSSGIDSNASGDSYYRGGLTTLHEKGYEVYDLPRGTRIYNHEASQDLVMKTAESVAARMAAGMGARSVNHTGTITVKGVNSQDEFLGIVDIVMDQLRREVRA